MTRYKFSAHQVWNCDETSYLTVMQPPNIIAEKGTKQVQQTVSAERVVNVTMLAFINAAGGMVPPVSIFPRKKLVRSLYEDGPTGCLSFVKCSKENPILLTLVNHCSHLDTRLRKTEVAKLASCPFVSTFTPSNIISGFQATGIFPMNRNAIKEARYAPSFVTERPNPITLDNSLPENDQATENTMDTLLSNTPLSADVVISCPPTDEAGSVNVTENVKNLFFSSTIADLIESIYAISPLVKENSGTSLTSTTSTSTTDGVIKSHVSPVDIRPLPQVSHSKYDIAPAVSSVKCNFSMLNFSIGLIDGFSWISVRKIAHQSFHLVEIPIKFGDFYP
ncbi:Uncharacterized protein APZ42_031337, partial [Daphnia magna]